MRAVDRHPGVVEVALAPGSAPCLYEEVLSRPVRRSRWSTSPRTEDCISTLSVHPGRRLLTEHQRATLRGAASSPPPPSVTATPSPARSCSIVRRRTVDRPWSALAGRDPSRPRRVRGIPTPAGATTRRTDERARSSRMCACSGSGQIQGKVRAGDRQPQPVTQARTATPSPIARSPSGPQGPRAQPVVTSSADPSGDTSTSFVTIVNGPS